MKLERGDMLRRVARELGHLSNLTLCDEQLPHRMPSVHQLRAAADV